MKELEGRANGVGVRRTRRRSCSDFILSPMELFTPVADNNRNLAAEEPYISITIVIASRNLRDFAEAEVKDASYARKVQKAECEKLRRNRFNEHFLELSNVLDPERPKNGKAIIVTDTIDKLKDLFARVNRLRAEHAVLTEESRELIQEKNELREETASLKSEIENLNLQFQQRVTTMFPCPPPMGPPLFMAPPPYSYPVTVPLPAAHFQMQPFPFFGYQNPYSPFMYYPNIANPRMYPTSNLYASTSQSSIRDSGTKSLDFQRGSSDEWSDDYNSNDVGTKLELKLPGGSITQKKELLLGVERKEKQPQWKRKSKVADWGCSSWASSSRGFQDSSSN